MTLVVVYPSKKILKENVGKSLRHIETSLFGAEYMPTGSIVSNRTSGSRMGMRLRVPSLL